MDPLNPGAALLCKLGSVCVHVEELLSPDGHPVDHMALESLLADAEVREWLELMRAGAFLPVRRRT